MVLSLGAILGCLVVVGYFIRRCFLSQTFFGKHPSPLRVLARTYLTPKAVVALLEVPGKTLVIGVTGSTLVTLGEAVMGAAENDGPPIVSHSPSFVTTLEESTHDLHDAEPGDETLRQVSERIQRKVSRLKQL
jgi:flagellar biogenesis protein FliO